MPAKPALRTELLFYLSFLAAAALLVGVATLLVATSFAPEGTFALVMLMIALEVGVFIVFGRYLVNRLVLWPLERVVATADAVADGDLGRRAPDAETRDFATLAARLNRMTDHLLDAQGQLVRSEKLASIGRLAADAGEFLRAHQLPLRIEQMIGHAVEPRGEGGEVARLRVGRTPPQVAVRHRIGGGDHALQGPQDQPVHEVAPEHDEHADFQRDHEHHQRERPLRSKAGRDQQGRHAYQQGGGGEE